MNWTLLSQYANIFLAAGLIVRLLSLRLYRIYAVFAIFLGYELLQSVVALVEMGVPNPPIDYRLTWIILRPPAWVLSLWMVHALLAALLRKLPGISRLSKPLFRGVFLGAALIALFTAIPEYLNRSNAGKGILDRTLIIVLALERAMSIGAILALLVMLAFILWFPVQMPRNLAVFSIGFVVYFSAKTTLLLMLTYLPDFYEGHRYFISTAISLVLVGCFAYWGIFIDSRGEIKQVRLGHIWQAREQTKLIGQLDAMNAALLAFRRQDRAMMPPLKR